MAQRQVRTEPRSTMSFVLSIAMHVAFFVVLFFAISWKTKPPAPVVAELWTPPPAAVPRPAPKPAPAPPPKVAPPPEPKVEAKPPEKVDIALEQEKEKERERRRLEEERKRLEALEQKRRKEEEARKREEAEKKRKEEEARQRAEAEQKRKEEEARAKAEQEKKAREAADKRLATELEQETRERMARELAKAPTQPGRREGVPVSVPGDPSATAGYVDKIRAKIQGNVILPSTFSGDPEAVYLVQQLPTGEILSVKLTKSSGNKALDDAWERAILKSSPLPLPEQREVFQSTLRLIFRPSDKR